MKGSLRPNKFHSYPKSYMQQNKSGLLKSSENKRTKKKPFRVRFTFTQGLDAIREISSELDSMSKMISYSQASFNYNLPAPIKLIPQLVKITENSGKRRRHKGPVLRVIKTSHYRNPPYRELR